MLSGILTALIKNRVLAEAIKYPSSPQGGFICNIRLVIFYS